VFGVTKGSPESKYPYIIVNGAAKKLGSGAYSTVFAATDKKTKEDVAVKKITKANLQPHDHDALKNEVDILHGVKDHANILGFIEYFEDSEHYYLITEQITGGELFDRICEKETYTEAEARKLIQVLVQTLAFLHSKSIAHRDLKPENLLMKAPKEDTEIVLADFGFAVRCKGKNLVQVCGTPDYVAPEVIKHEAYDYKCDIWSAGVIAYILLGGYAPFQARNPDDRDELFRVIKKGRVVFHEKYWQHVSEDAKDCIRQMLLLDPDERTSAAALLNHAWFRAAALETHDLNESQVRLREFNARRKLKGAVHTVKAANTMRKVLGTIKSMKASEAAAGGGAAPTLAPASMEPTAVVCE